MSFEGEQQQPARIVAELKSQARNDFQWAKTNQTSAMGKTISTRFQAREGENLFAGMNLPQLGFAPVRTVAGENVSHVFIRKRSGAVVRGPSAPIRPSLQDDNKNEQRVPPPSWHPVRNDNKWE